MAQAFVWGQGGAQLTPEQVAQQRAIAAALMKEGSSYAPVGSWLEGLGRVAQAAAGAFKEYRANQAEKAGQEAWQQKFAALSPSLGGSAYGGSLDMAAPSASQDKMRSDAGITGTQANAGEAFASVAPRLIGDLSKDFGLTPEQAAGVVGQLGHESGGFGTLQEVNPMVPGSRGGYGYAQWTGPRRKAFEEYARTNGLDPASYEANYGFLKRELMETPEGAVLKDIAAAPDAITAGRIFTDKFLRPGIPGYESRDKWTERALAYADPSAMGGQMTGGNPQPEVAAALMGTNPDIPQRVTPAGQQPMPQMQRPVSTAGLNYDPATGTIGPAANLGAGATLAPAATAAFYGTQTPVQQTDTPILRQIAGLLGGGSSTPQQAAPNGQQAVAQALAGQTAQPQGNAAPQGMPSIGQLMELAADPYAPESAKAVVSALIQQQLQQQDPAYRMGLEKARLELEQLRNPPPPKLDTFTGPDGTVYSFNPVTGANRPLTGAKADPGYRLLTPDEVSRQGLPAGAYQVGPDGKISQVGGSGVNVNLGNTPSKSVFDTVAARSEDARAAAAALPAFANARAAIDSGKIILGAGADLRLGMQKIGALLGFDPSAAENTETFRSAIAPVVLAAVRGLGAGTGISNADRDFAEKAAGGNITLEPNSIRRLLDIGQRAAEAKIKNFNETLDKVYAPGDPESDRVRALFAVPIPDLTPVVPAGTSRSTLGLGADKAKVDALIKKYGGQ